MGQANGSILLRKKGIEQVKALAEDKAYKLKREIGTLELLLLFIGSLIGAGIFVLPGVAAAKYAGPAVSLSYLLGGIVCICVGLCYVEFASMAPFAGSAYTYAYIALGEILAWIVGWDLLFEFTVVCSTVSVGWSGYVVSFLKSLGINLPAALTRDIAHGGIINLPAILGLLLVGYIAYSGIKNVSRTNTLLTVIKLSAILFFVACGLFHLKPANWHPFAPFGLAGIMTGAALTFFAYTGFDGITAVLEEVKNPQRSIPIALIGGLAIVILLYVGVAAVLTGVVNYTRLDVPDPAAFALMEMGIRWGGALISVAILFGLIAVMLGYGLSATRILFAMSRDGLLPPVFARVHERTRVPHIATLVIFGVAILGGGFLSINELAELANIGGLTAFTVPPTLGYAR
ncbi:amino acid permease [Ammonifex degensii]|uniref:amino acid permease n=1 Tax=Ammonifex degensii TaxID=42838 RepID=UPI0002EA4F21|nr:amino acid permease [Ammonifex degensii]